MSETAVIASKILPHDAIRLPACTFSLECTEEELLMLILGRFKSTLGKHGASFTVDDFTTTLYLLASARPNLPRSSSLLAKLEKEDRIAIVDFSPADIYRIVGEPDVYRIVDRPSPNPQTRS